MYQPGQVAWHCLPAHAVDAGGGDGREGNAHSFHEFGFHAALRTDPQRLDHRLRALRSGDIFLLESVKDGEGGIDAAAGPAGADQKTH